MEIRIYDPPVAQSPRFIRRGLVMGATAVQFTERLYAPGCFTIEIPWGGRHAQTLAIGRLVQVDRSLWGIIDDLNLSVTAQGLTLQVSGRQLNGLTVDRITIPPDSQGVTGAQGYDTATGSTETCMKHFVRGNLLNALQPDRALFGLEIARDQGRGTADDKYITRHEGLSDVLASLGEASGLGYDITADLARHKFVFDVIAGQDHTALQSDRTRVIFDVARKTCLSQHYSHNTSDSRNLFYVTKSGSEFADEALTVSYTRGGEELPVGIRRREAHLELSAETPTAGEEYNELRRMAMIEAEGFRPAESFACEISDGGHYRYRRDYRLGDLVSVVNRDCAVTMHARLTEMQTDYSASGLRHTATFGTAALNVFGRLKRQIAKGL